MSFLSAVSSGVDASGGTTVTTFTDSGGTQYRIHAFENVGNDTFTVNSAPSDATVDVLVVGGGGGGGGWGGGGGAGGVIDETAVGVSPNSYTVSVGSGGAGDTIDGDYQLGQNGGDSSVFGLTAIGGGGAGRYDGDAGLDGGSGGGGGMSGGGSGAPGGNALQPSSPSGGFGNDGGKGGGNPNNYETGGGGGGATEAGKIGDYSFINKTDAGKGGDGLDVSNAFGTQFGENGVFGGGGGGHTDFQTGGSVRAAGGAGGGGDGGQYSPNVDGEGGVANTGGGGGGAYSETGDGGSGIVLIRYEI